MKKITLTFILSLFVFCLGKAQQITIPRLQNIFDIYKGTYLQSSCDFTTKKSIVNPYDFIEISLGFDLEGFTGEQPGWFKIYFSNDTIIDSGDTMVQKYRFKFSDIATTTTPGVQVKCNNFPQATSLYVILKLEFDSANYPIANDRCYKKLSFYKSKTSLLYSTFVSLNDTQVDQGVTLHTFLEISNNTGETQQAGYHNFYLCKTSTFDPNQSILLKNEFLGLPTGYYGDYGNLMGDTIHPDSRKIIGNYPLLIPDTVSSGDYYVFAIEQGKESEYQCMYYLASNKIHIGTTVGINSTSMTDELIAYPNPVNQELHIDLKRNASTIQVEITNVLGEKLRSHSIYGQQNIQLDMNGFKTGMYFIMITADDQRSLLKILKTE